LSGSIFGVFFFSGFVSLVGFCWAWEKI